MSVLLLELLRRHLTGGQPPEAGPPLKPMSESGINLDLADQGVQPPSMPGISVGQNPQPGMPLSPVGPSPALSRVPAGSEMETRLRDLFQPAPAAPAAPPAPRPMPAPMRPEMRGPTADPQASPNGDPITAADVQRFIRSVAVGAARVDPRSPGMSAFAQGAAGSLTNSYGEKERERMIAAQETERRRANDLRLEKESRLQQSELARQLREERRDNRNDRLTDSRVKLTDARLKKLTDPALDNKDRIAIERLIRDKERDLRREIDNGRLDDKAARTKLEEYKTQLEQDFAFKRRRQQQTTQPTAIVPGQTYELPDGKKVRLKPGGNPINEADYELVP